MHQNHYIFGYGSLINQKSRMRTISNAVNAFPAKISNFERSWSYKCPKRNYTAVAVTRTTTNTHINGVLIPIQNEAQLAAFDKRECNYARGIIPLSHITILGDTQLPANSIVWVYENHTSLAKNYSTTSASINCCKHIPSPKCPIPQSYLDCILVGCLTFGREFAQEFIKSTKGWCPKSFLNDRYACPKTRKYVCHKESGENMACGSCVGTVDSILTDMLPLEFKNMPEEISLLPKKDLASSSLQFNHMHAKY